MFSATGWIWLLGSTLAMLLGAYAWSELRRALRRRARRAYYTRAARASGPMPLPGSSHPAPLSGGMTPGQATAICAHAERSAQRDWVAGRAAALNPYDHGTHENVLWYTTYQLRMGELAEQGEADAERGGRERRP